MASADWFTFSIDAGPGPRGGSRHSTVRTEVRTARLCPSCCQSPSWSPLLNLLQDQGEPAGGTGGRCVVLCTSHKPVKRHHRSKLRPNGILTWPGSGLYRCPMCYRRALGWTTWAAPRAVRDMAAKVIRRRRTPRRWYQESAAAEAARIEEQAWSGSDSA